MYSVKMLVFLRKYHRMLSRYQGIALSEVLRLSNHEVKVVPEHCT